MNATTRQASRRGVLLLAAACLLGPAAAEEHVVRSARDLAGVLPRVAPGDVIILEDGSWRDQVLEFAAEGRAGQPIVLRARTPGGVRLEGASRLRLSGRWLHVEGLRFEGGALARGQAVVEFRGRLGEASDSRLTDSAIVRVNPPDPATRYAWVQLHGERNRVDHNRFEGQAHSGVTVVVERRPGRVEAHRIDHNHFVDRPPGSGNGFESIRIGTSDSADSDSRTTVERNVFERTDGELEIVSVKSGANVLRANVFLQSVGTLTLRHGSGSLVEGNVFDGGHRPGTGGIRVMGEGHVVRGNLLQRLQGRGGGAITFTCGPLERRPGDNPPVRDVRIESNLIAEVAVPAFKADTGCGTEGRSVRAETVALLDNTVAGPRARWLDGQPGAGWTVRGNRFDGPADAALPAAGVAATPGAAAPGSDGLWRTKDGPRAAEAPRLPAPGEVGPGWWR